MGLLRKVASRLIVALMAASVLAPLHAGTAAAAISHGAYKTKQASIVVAPGASGAVTASCPTGYLVLTGGAYWHPLNTTVSDPSIYTTLRSSSPTSKLTGWYGTGINHHNQSMQLTAVAQCMPKAAFGTYSVLKRDVVVDPSRPGNADLHCKSGQTVIEGGGAWHKPGLAPKAGLNAHLTTSIADFATQAHGWSVAGFNESTIVLDLRVIVVCVPSAIVGGTATNHYDGGLNSSKSAIGGDVRETYANCDAGQRAVAGGVAWGYLSTPDTDTRNEIEGSTIASQGTFWYGAGRYTDQRAPTNALYFTVLVLCLKLT